MEKHEIKCGKCHSTYIAPWYTGGNHNDAQYHCPVCYKGNPMTTKESVNVYKQLLKD